MLKQYVAHIDEREKLIATAVAELASELRLIEVEDLVGFIRERQFGNIGQLVASSTELYYKPGTLTFANSADNFLAWGRDPVVALDLKFENCGVRVFFRLFLECQTAGIEINYFSVDGREGNGNPDADTRRLCEAIDNAKFRDLIPAN